MPRSLRYVAFDQLHERYGVMSDAVPGEDVILLVENEAMLSGTNW